MKATVNTMRGGVLPLALALCGASQATAQVVDWGSSVSLAQNTHLSNGSAAGSGFLWTIGYFADGFVPTADNYASWATNYTEVDRVQEGIFDLGGGMQAWAASGHKSDVGAAAGRQAYIFAYNSLGSLGTAAGEALLVRENGFLFPEIPNQDTFDIADNPWDTKDDSFDVVWGRVDRDQYAAGGLKTGGGAFSSPLGDTSDGSWEVQTGTWALVPEPCVSLLAALAIPGLLVRRRSVVCNPTVP